MINIDRYRGIIYKSKGRDFDGVDCWGLVYLIYKHEFDILIPSWSAEYENSDNVSFANMLKSQEHYKGWEMISRPVIGCVALFEIAGRFHVGICVDKKGRQILHITKSIQVSIEDVNSISWASRFRGWWQYAGN